MRLLIIGTGYVGLVTGACFAEMGHHVTCLDIDQNKIRLLLEGEIPIYEPGLSEIVERNQKAGRLEFTTDYQRAKGAQVCFIAVPTPSAEDGSADLKYVKKAAFDLGTILDDYAVIVNKSTVPVGTTEVVREVVEKACRNRYTFDVVSNPEFLKEGDAIQDFMKPDRIVIGSSSEKATEIMKELYAPFNLSHDRLLVMDPASAELTKYAANAMLACRISFMNELSQICEHVGADIRLIRKGIGSDRRIGYPFLYAGVGYGGSCFPKDVRALSFLAQKLGVSTALISSIEDVNRQQKQVMGDKVERFFEEQGGLSGKRIAIWGLAFKPGTDDLREAPALTLIRFLCARGAIVSIFDPVALSKGQELFPDNDQIEWAQTEYEAAAGCDALVLMTEWKQFRFVNFKTIRSSMRYPVLFDGRNQYSPKEMHQMGFHYFGIGTPSKGEPQLVEQIHDH